MKRPITFLTGLIAAAACHLGAQEASPNSSLASPRAVSSSATSSSSECTYNTCALRMKLSWGSWRIIRGEQEEQVTKLGMFSTPTIEPIVAASPDAALEARTFDKNYGSGEILQAVGVALMGVGIAAASTDNSAVIPITTVLGGGALLFYGVSRRVRAFNSLNTAIWLYNRTLKR